MGFHLLLLVIFLAGSAFRTAQPESASPRLMTVYQASALPPETALPAEPQVELPKSPPPAITPKNPVTPANPVRPQNTPSHVVVPILTGITRPAPTHSTGHSGGPVREPLVNQFDVAIAAIKNNLTAGTQVKIPDHGPELDPDYAGQVKEIYQMAWILPDDIANDNAITKVRVTIDRNGVVISALILSPSGDANVDSSVQRTLDRVTFVAPFPDGATEKERTFIINFNLKTKRMLG
jgi:TonB family protein